MALRLLNRIKYSFQQIEQIIYNSLFGKFPREEFCIAGVNVDNRSTKQSYSIEDLFQNSILWAVPKHRRTIEKRLKRKYGDPYYVLKTLRPKKHLRVCSKCGHDYEVGVLCPTCYAKILEETEAIQEKIQAELGLNPVDKDVVVLYENEKIETGADEFYKDKRIVELKKPRPAWFSKNLLQKSTQQPATTTDVKPTQLG